MAIYTLSAASVFPDGTSVGAYLARDQTSGGSPAGTAINTQTMSGGSATFTGLTEDVTYSAIGQVGGLWRRTDFTVDLLPTAEFLATQIAYGGTTGISATDVEGALDEIASEMVRDGSVDSVMAAVLATPDTTNDQNGFVVKAPDASWGTGAYGTGQAFMVLREDYVGGAEGEPDRNVMFRVDRYGGIGSTGGIHVAVGLRNPDQSPAPTQSVWIDPTDDVVGIVIDSGDEGATSDFLRMRSAAGANKLVIDKDGDLIWGTGAGDTTLYRSTTATLKTDGNLLATGDIQVRLAAASQVGLGDVSGGKGGIALGTSLDTKLYRDSAGTLKTDGSVVVVGDEVVRSGAATQVFLGDVLFGGAKAGISLGSSADVNLYRDAADTLKTDDKLHVAGELEFDGALNHDGSTVGFYGTAPAAKPTVTGSRGGNAALADLLTDLATLGLITDSTTA